MRSGKRFSPFVACSLSSSADQITRHCLENGVWQRGSVWLFCGLSLFMFVNIKSWFIPDVLKLFIRSVFFLKRSGFMQRQVGSKNNFQDNSNIWVCEFYIFLFINCRKSLHFNSYFFFFSRILKYVYIGLKIQRQNQLSGLKPVPTD